MVTVKISLAELLLGKLLFLLIQLLSFKASNSEIAERNEMNLLYWEELLSTVTLYSFIISICIIRMFDLTEP